MPSAQFSINADSTNQGFDGSDGLALSFALRSSQGVSRWVLQVFDAASFDPAQPIEANPPRQSPGATELVLDNGAGNTGQLVTAASVVSSITSTLPSGEVSAWIVRSIVNNGVTSSGRSDPALIAERIVIIPDSNNLRAVPPTERTQYHDDGWTEALARILAGGGGSPSTPVSETIWTSNDTLTVLPEGETFEIETVAGGASGGTAGTFPTTSLIGGVPGGGGARNVERISRAELSAALPVTITVGTGGAEPGDVTAVPFSTAAGLDGNPGTLSSFGDISRVFGGGAGLNSSSTNTPRAGGSGGGRYSAGTTDANSTEGGAPLGSLGTNPPDEQGVGPDGGQGSHRDMLVAPPTATSGGGAGASANLGTVNPEERRGGASRYGGGGGGAGGAIGAASAIITATDGGKSGLLPVGEVGGNGGLAGASVAAGSLTGNDGADGADGNDQNAGSGGGGGSCIQGAVDGSVSGKGGAGGFPGGGGGGGGACERSGANMTTTSRTGGKGGDGRVRLRGFA